MQDIVVKDGAGRLHFKWLEWDTDFFGRPSYILDLERSALVASPELERALRESLEGAFAAARFDNATAPEVLMLFQGSGFYCVDTELTLGYEATAAPVGPPDPSVQVEEVRKNEGLPYDHLGKVFSLTRFHYDPHIGKERADRLWVEYIRSFRPSPQARLYVARCGGEAAGCVTVLTRGPSRVLSFVAVLDGFRGRKVGAALLRAASADLGGAGFLTETQARNITAINFYIRNGFRRMEKTSVVMHSWGD